MYKIEDQNARFAVLNKLAQILQKLMTVDELCKLYMELFADSTWEDAYPLISQIVEQIDVTNRILQEQQKIASLDLQTCQMHQTNKERMGVVCNDQTCLLCGQSIYDQFDSLEHIEQVVL